MSPQKWLFALKYQWLFRCAMKSLKKWQMRNWQKSLETYALLDYCIALYSAAFLLCSEFWSPFYLLLFHSSYASSKNCKLMDEFLQLLESVTLLRKKEESSLMTMKLLQQVFSAKGITKMASFVGSFINHMDILTKFYFTPPPPRQGMRLM